jgi:hypothetical protein
MSDLTVAIAGFVAGDDLEIRRTVTGLPSAMTIAWLTIKRHASQTDAQAKLQKRITVTDVPDTGRIVVAGGPGVDGDLRFDLTKADTLLLGTKSWVHDIQIKLATGKIYTIEKGTIQLTEGVTVSTA